MNRSGEELDYVSLLEGSLRGKKSKNSTVRPQRVEDESGEISARFSKVYSHNPGPSEMT